MIRADEVTPRSDAEARALLYFTSLMRRDFDGFADLWHEEAILKVPFRPDESDLYVPPAFVGKATIVAHHEYLKRRRDHVFLVEMILSADNTVVIELSGRSVVGDTGAVYENSYVYNFVLEDGLYREVREYVNPVPVVAALKAVLEAQEDMVKPAGDSGS